MNIMPTTLVASVLLAGFALVAAPTAHAQINYQGRLTDATGAALADGQYTLEFSLWDAATGGNKLWGPYVADGVTGIGHGPKAAVVDGRFNIVIGDRDKVEVLLKDKLAASLTTYLQIQVETSAPISPRQIILPAPRALVADVLPNVVPNATGVTLSGNAVVQADATAGTHQLAIRGKTDVAKELLLAYNTTDNYGSIQAKDGTGNKPLILNPAGGAVGIGKTAPGSALDVNGEIRASAITVDPITTVDTGGVKGKPPIKLTLGSKSDPTNWHAVEVPGATIKKYLADADGGTIRFILRQISDDTVRMADIKYVIENPDLNGGAAAGMQGCSYGFPNNDYNQPPSYTFKLGTAVQQDLMIPMHGNWLYMRNYYTRPLTGVTGSSSTGFVADSGIPDNEYKVEFILAPNLYATIIIYDR
jgi:hypothetical protein